MTENEAKQLLGRSPTETAAQLLWFTGRPWAKKLATFQLRSLCNFTKPPVLAIGFWAAVLMRLDMATADMPALEPKGMELARFKSIERRAFDAGLKS